MAGDPVGDLAGKEFVAFGLFTEVILGLGGLSRDGEVANPPSVIQVADDLAIGPGCVDAGALGDGRKVVEKVMVLAVEHQLPRHGHEAPDHRAVSEHSLLWVSFHHLPDHPGVERFMACLVGRDLAANPGEILLPFASGHLGDISVRNPGLRAPGTRHR